MTRTRMRDGIALSLSVAACLAPAVPVRAADAVALRVAAAMSLRPAIAELVPRFRADHGADVLLHAAASGVLLQQVRRGAPGDVLLSASPAEVDRLVAAGLALGRTRTAIAANALVVVVPAGRHPPRRLEQLLDMPGPIAVGNPRTAPLGRYGEQALRSLGLWAALEPRLVYAENARHALDYVARGEVVAGLVYRTDARRLTGRVVTGPPVPAAAHDPIVYEGVVLTGSARAQIGRTFLSWLAAGAGGEVLRRHGFLTPPPS